MRKRFLLYALAFVVFFVAFSFSKSSKPAVFGIGLILGEPTGITLKYWFDNTSAVDMAFAWSFEGKTSFRIHGDYLYHFKGVFNVPGGDLFPYLGAGLCVNISENPVIGIRVPLGLEYFLGAIPLEIFLELVPVVNIYPATRLGGNAGLGLRYYF
jgi:hypothetical protein